MEYLLFYSTSEMQNELSHLLLGLKEAKVNKMRENTKKSKKNEKKNEEKEVAKVKKTPKRKRQSKHQIVDI